MSQILEDLITDIRDGYETIPRIILIRIRYGIEYIVLFRKMIKVLHMFVV